MKILTLEFSCSQRSVAILDSAAPKEKQVLSSVSDAVGRGVTGMALVDRAVREAQVQPPGIELIAVSLGPGSYAGIRSAIAIAQGWQLARAIPAIGINTVQCIVAEARARGLSGETHVIVDAQRREVYHAAFHIDSDRCDERSPLRIIPLDTLPSTGTVIGPDASKLCTRAVDLYPTAKTLGALALDASAIASGPASELEPVYLRETTFVKAPPIRVL